MEYLDFELRVSHGRDAGYFVHVIHSPAGESSGPMKFPFEGEALGEELRAVARAVRQSSRQFRDIESRDIEPGGSHRTRVMEFGSRLFDALMPEAVRETFRNSLHSARITGKGLRIRLRLDVAELAGVPWEYLYDSREREYVVLSGRTPLVRYLETQQQLETLEVRPPLSILGMISSPTDLPALDVQREKQRIEIALADIPSERQVKLTWLEGSTADDLQRAMRKGPYHILHFVGHGGFDVEAGEGLVALTEPDGRSALKTATQFGRLLRNHDSLKMVVLNSCLGARTSPTDMVSSTASRLTFWGIPAVVAMQYEISDDAAIDFARAFYASIADGTPVDTAVSEARKTMSVGAGNSFEWGTPVLYLRAPHGALFSILNDPPPTRLAGPPIFDRTAPPVLDPHKQPIHERLARWRKPIGLVVLVGGLIAALFWPEPEPAPPFDASADTTADTRGNTADTGARAAGTGAAAADTGSTRVDTGMHFEVRPDTGGVSGGKRGKDTSVVKAPIVIPPVPAFPASALFESLHPRNVSLTLRPFAGRWRVHLSLDVDPPAKTVVTKALCKLTIGGASRDFILPIRLKPGQTRTSSDTTLNIAFFKSGAVPASCKTEQGVELFRGSVSYSVPLSRIF